MPRIWTSLGLAYLAGTALAATPAEWRSQSVYFLLTDRFARSDGSTTAACDTDGRGYCGGTWQGIIDQLDYIQGMGFTAIWITPVTEQLQEETPYGTAYHGYWQQDIYEVNSNHGTAEDLKALSDALHKRGMYLMVDVVANHMGYAGAGSSVDYSVFNPFNSQEYFHSYCPVKDYENQQESENCWLGDNSVSLPDLDTTKDEVKQIWYDWVGSLVSNYSIDGLRIDTVKHVQKDFWPGYNDAAGVYCIGEVLDGDPSYTCGYQEVMDGVLNYPIYYPLLNAFKSTSGSMDALYNMVGTVKSECADSTLLGTFIENHDNPRFASYTDDIALAKNVAAFLIFADGIPIIYAGQEQHYNGGEDPANREATWLSGFSTTSDLYKLIAASNGIRNHAISKDKAYVTYQQNAIYKDTSTIALRKGTDGSQVISVLSNLGASGNKYTLSLGGSGYKAGDELTEIYTCTKVTVDSDGNIPVPMESGEPRAFYPTAGLEGSKICA